MVSDRAMKTAPYLAKDPEGHQAVNVLVKLAYVLEPGGGLVPAPDPVDFAAEDVLEAKGDEPGTFPTEECEIIPFKLRTDVVVTGTIRTPDAYPRRDMLAGVRIGPYGKAIQVFGDRRIEAGKDGALIFTPPEPFTEMPLAYTRAYGGVDPSVPRVNDDPRTAEEWLEYLTLERHPGVYPRNPVGSAYVVNPHPWLLFGRPLPNFEDPDDLLTPERIVVTDPRLWWRQPIPAGLGWFGRSWYPRSVLGGLAPPLPAAEPAKLREVELGIVPADHADRIADPDLDRRMRREFFNGASPGLAVPLLRGDEPVSLVGLDVAGERRFRLPGEVPRVSMAFRGEAMEVRVHLHTVWIRKDEDLVTLVWSALARPPRMLPVTLPTREAPEVDELEGMEIRVEGREVPHEPVNLGKSPL